MHSSTTCSPPSPAVPSRARSPCSAASGADHVELLAGPVTTVGTLADIPLPDTGDRHRPAGPRTLALVPYRQITERGFACVDDGAPLECLRVTARATGCRWHALAGAARRAGAQHRRAASTSPTRSTPRSSRGCCATRSAAARAPTSSSTGSSTATRSTADPLAAALAAFRRLLVAERGAYWTFLVHTGTRTLVGATPERHVSVEDGLVMMNPISGTFRHGQPARRPTCCDFLADPKEIDELYMVLDEELKMMATVAEHGGQVVGPYLKEMAHLTHTEYLLAGRGSLRRAGGAARDDVRADGHRQPDRERLPGDRPARAARAGATTPACWRCSGTTRRAGRRWTRRS